MNRYGKCNSKVRTPDEGHLLKRGVEIREVR